MQWGVPPTVKAKRPGTTVTKRITDIRNLSSPSGARCSRNRNIAASDAAQAETPFLAIVAGRSPWPDWFVPAESHLDPGTRFQMAMGPKQPTKITKYGQQDNEPGGWGTFNNIKNVEDVREYLAVLPEFKPEIDRVNAYVVVIPMPVKVGPVGPQVNPDGCTLYSGGWSQFEISAGRGQRMQYLQLESSRPFGTVTQPAAVEAE